MFALTRNAEEKKSFIHEQSTDERSKQKNHYSLVLRLSLSGFGSTMTFWPLRIAPKRITKHLIFSLRSPNLIHRESPRMRRTRFTDTHTHTFTAAPVHGFSYLTALLLIRATSIRRRVFAL